MRLLPKTVVSGEWLVVSTSDYHGSPVQNSSETLYAEAEGVVRGSGTILLDDIMKVKPPQANKGLALERLGKPRLRKFRF